jgi:TnpA family transposase
VCFIEIVWIFLYSNSDRQLHFSRQPFHVQVISTGVHQAPYALNGLLYHESDLEIEEHFTNTGGYTDQIFAMFHLLGYRFAPRLRRFNDYALYTPSKTTDYPALQTMIGGRITPRLIQQRWDDTLRLASSVKLGTVTASLALQRLSSYARQNIEGLFTPFTLKALTTLSRFPIADDYFGFNLPVLFTFSVWTKVTH